MSFASGELGVAHSARLSSRVSGLASEGRRDNTHVFMAYGEPAVDVHPISTAGLASSQRSPVDGDAARLRALPQVENVHNAPPLWRPWQGAVPEEANIWRPWEQSDPSAAAVESSQARIEDVAARSSGLREHVPLDVHVIAEQGVSAALTAMHQAGAGGTAEVCSPGTTEARQEPRTQRLNLPL